MSFPFTKNVDKLVKVSVKRKINKYKGRKKLKKNSRNVHYPVVFPLNSKKHNFSKCGFFSL